MQLNPSEISELIKDRIKNFEGAAEARTEGTVVSLMDGIRISRQHLRHGAEP
jgi:F-type H+-transporting ATPase subunit alpha